MYSLSNKFIFFHPGRSGGTSIKKFLAQNFKDCTRCGHKSLSHIERLVSDAGYNPHEFKKITCVRNPWDRMVSNYFHTLKHNKIPETHLLIQIKNFRENLRAILQDRPMTDNLYHNFFPNYEDFDFVVRLENIHKDMKSLCEILCIDYIFLDKSNSSNPGIPYNLFYDKESSELIEKYFYRCIEKFDYKSPDY